MKRILIGLVIGLVLLEAGRRLVRPSEEAAAAGNAAYRAGDFTAAEERFRQAESGASDPALVAHNHAAALYQMGRFPDADRTYERSADSVTLHAARADYDRGNCAFREACKDEGSADPELLERAAQHYEKCLAQEEKTPAAGSLFDDARHNLELTRLILGEFAEAKKKANGADPANPDKPSDPSTAHNDPFDPSNAAHPPGGEDKESAKDGAKSEKSEREAQPKASQVANSDPNNPQTRECKQCQKGGCPRCKKKPGKGPGPIQTARKSDGPKPNPGKDDNGKAPGQAKSPNEANHPGAGKKGKPGEGGTPNPNDKNGVGDAKQPGTGPSDETQARKEGKSTEGKVVGPGGVSYEKQDNPSRDGKTGGGDEGTTDEVKQPQPGGKDGSALGAPGESRQPHDAKDPSSPDKGRNLLPPSPPGQKERDDPGTGGGTFGSARLGSGKYGPDAEETDGSGDPVERAAVRRLRQAIQRIQNARESRPAPTAPAPGENPASNRRRDW
jgi:hypothetical protein